jgi:hypothetical protein
MLQLKKEKTDAIRFKLEEQAVQNLQSTPAINKKSKSINRTVDDMLAWEAERKAKLEVLALEAKLQEDAAITGRPVVTAMSRRIPSCHQENCK